METIADSCVRVCARMCVIMVQKARRKEEAGPGLRSAYTSSIKPCRLLVRDLSSGNCKLLVSRFRYGTGPLGAAWASDP
jgi:hypothetical protein